MRLDALCVAQVQYSVHLQCICALRAVLQSMTLLSIMPHAYC